MILVIFLMLLCNYQYNYCIILYQRKNPLSGLDDRVLDYSTDFLFFRLFD